MIVQNVYRVTISPDVVSRFAWRAGMARYVGKADDGGDLYRVTFGVAPYQHSREFRASDLRFEKSA
jgi:hypothetical protein